MPESNLHGHCVVNPQMFSQEEFQELNFVPDHVLGDDGMYTLIGILMRWLGTWKVRRKKGLCVNCNPTNPLYNSRLIVKTFLHIFQDIFTKQNKDKKYKFRKENYQF